MHAKILTRCSLVAAAVGLAACPLKASFYEEYILTKDAAMLGLPLSNHFRVRDGADAPTGLKVQKCHSGASHNNVYAPPTTNITFDGGNVVYYTNILGNALPADCMDYESGTCWMGDDDSSSGPFADQGQAGFVAADVSCSEPNRSGWLRAFSSTRFTNSAYYGDSRLDNPALDQVWEINADFDPANPMITNVNPAYVIPFGVSAPVDYTPAANELCAVTGSVAAGAGNNVLPPGLVSVHWENVTIAAAGVIAVAADGSWAGYVAVTNRTAVTPLTNQIVFRAIGVSARPGLPVSPPVTRYVLGVPEPGALCALAGLVLCAWKWRRS